MESELDEEMRLHLDLHTERLMRERGLREPDARRIARAEFGGVDNYKESVRDVRGISSLHGLSMDLKLGVRMLVKYPGLTIAGTLTIAVAVALAASWHEFSLDIINPRLPFDEADRIVVLRNWNVESNDVERRSMREFAVWRRELRSLTDLVAAQQVAYNATTDDRRSAALRGAQMTATGFSVTRVAPLLGRTLTAEDEAESAPLVAVIGYGVWQSLYDGDRTIVGKTIRLGASPATIVGVMPEGFAFPSNQEIWTPLRPRFALTGPRDGPRLSMMARLAPGVSLREAQAELTAISKRSAGTAETGGEKMEARVQKFGTGDGMAMMARLMNIPFILFLLVVCANVATLVYARTATREGEIAVRTALGASRRRIVFQLFGEAFVLTTTGAVAGLLASYFLMGRAMALFFEVQQEPAPFWFDSGLATSTVVYTLLMSLLAACVIGGMPALKATGRRLRDRMAQPGSGGASLRFGAASTSVVIVQVALCVAFLPIAVRSGQALLPEKKTEESFPSEAFLTGRLIISGHEESEVTADGFGARVSGDGETPLERAAVYDRVKRDFAAERGVQGVAFVDRMPGFNHPVEVFELENDTTFYDEVRVVAADLDYFNLMGGRVTAGRALRSDDVTNDRAVMVVDRAWVDEVMTGRNPIGQRIRFPEDKGDDRWYEIVGVVEGMQRANGPGEQVMMYRPFVPGREIAAQFYMRAAAAPEQLVARVRDIVSATDNAAVVADVKPLDEAWAPVYKSNVFFIGGLTLVSGIILAFALIGIYAIMSFTVSQRAREIGIRVALGANPRAIVLSVFRRAFYQIGAGVVAGAAIISLTLMKTPQDMKLVALIAGLIMTFGLVGSLIPAGRALRIQPTDALRAE
jgi:predicted permease